MRQRLTNDPDDLLPPPPGPAERRRRQLRVRPRPSGPRRDTPLRDDTLRIEALQRLAGVRLRCSCGWAGGYGDLERFLRACPRCWRVESLEQETCARPAAASQIHLVVRPSDRGLSVCLVRFLFGEAA